MKTSEETNELATALAKIQGEIKNVPKESTNPHFKSKYADLASDLDIVRPVCSRHGVGITQTMYKNDGEWVLETTLRHTSGQWLSGDYPILPEKPGPQALRSAVTYARRTTLEAILGIAGEDDDGNLATGKTTQMAHQTLNPPRQITTQVQRLSPETAAGNIDKPIQNKAPGAGWNPGKQV